MRNIRFLALLSGLAVAVGCGGPTPTTTAVALEDAPAPPTAPPVLFHDLDYANWRRFPVGTQVKRKSVTSAKKAAGSTTSVETFILKEVTDREVVVVRQNTTTRSDGSYHAVNPPDQRKHPRSFAIPPGMSAEDFSKPSRAAKKAGEEVLMAAGAAYKATVYAWADQTESGTMNIRVWLSDDMPGRIVKQEMTVAALGNTTIDEVIDVRIPAAAGAESRKAFPPYTKPTLIAHRGASWDAPEHTLAAYELALKHGADFVEPDLQMTKDGVLVCLHDLTLERTTDVAKVFPDRAREVTGKKSWPVADFTLAEIQKLDAGSWKGAKFAGAKVPTFQQMIDAVKGKAGLIPETKAPEVYGRLGLNMEKALMQVLEANKLDTPGGAPRTPVVIQSFSAHSLKALRKSHGCKLPLVLLVGKGDLPAEQLREVKGFADGVGPSKNIVLARPGLVGDAHALGLSVTVWTFRAGQTGRFKEVRSEMAHFLRDLKVDAVFTDNPDQFPRD